MALSSINISFTNKPGNGYIEINSTKNQNVSSDISYVLIFRRLHGFGRSYERVYEKVITNNSQLSFTDRDLTTKSGNAYDYYIELTDGNTAGYNVIEFGSVNNVECWFDGLFVGNDSEQYFAPLNCDTSYSRNTQSNYVTTLSGRTPYRISNANTNYTIGQSTALFVPLDNEGQPMTVETKEYINSVVDFLTDGNEKILKTSDGQAWYISVDPTVEITSDDHYIGSSMINFNWTETGDIPILKKVVS